MNRKMAPISKLYVFLIMLFLYAPIVVMIFFSFNASSSTGVFTGFSLRWYESLLHDSATINALKNTLILAVASSGVATVMGTAAAVGINNYKNKYIKSTVMSVTNLPMMNPEIVTGISMMLLFVVCGNIIGRKETLGFETMLIAHVTFCLPYVILSVLPKLFPAMRALHRRLRLKLNELLVIFPRILPVQLQAALAGTGCLVFEGTKRQGIPAYHALSLFKPFPLSPVGFLLRPLLRPVTSALILQRNIPSVAHAAFPGGFCHLR